MIKYIRNLLYKMSGNPKFCYHEFKGKDMMPRNKQGLVFWSCHKCKKEFQAECGLDILTNGKCIGDWKL